MTVRWANPSVVLIRDPRKRVGGLETWVETLAHGLPQHEVAVVILVPGDEHDAAAVGRRLVDVDVIRIDASEGIVDQAQRVVNSLATLAKAGRRGVFFTMGYPYMNVAVARAITSHATRPLELRLTCIIASWRAALASAGSVHLAGSGSQSTSRIRLSIQSSRKLSPRTHMSSFRGIGSLVVYGGL